MCGITGIAYFNSGSRDAAVIKNMSKKISHRGMDDEGYVLINRKDNIYKELSGDNSMLSVKNKYKSVSSESGFVYDLAFGHNRLAIIDTSENGHQPMTDENSRYWIVYNGEIYNYIEIREELKSNGYRFFTNTDTEVLLKAYIHWGTGCLKRMNGMFSFAIWDSIKGILFCARDRFGVKPFNYYYDEDKFVFGSEIKAILASDNIKAKVNERRLANYLVSGMKVNHKDTFFKDIFTLPPAHFLIISNNKLSIERYWEISVSRKERNKSEIINDVDEILLRSVKRHLRSDVPVSFCLSGGLDSSSLVSITYENSLVNDRINTFSSCFEDKEYDERFYINKFLDGKNINPNFVFPDTQGFKRDIEKLVWHQEEPFGGISIFAQWALMKEINRKRIKVVIDGQGADELFGGYNSFIIPYLYSKIANIDLNGFNKCYNDSKIKLNKKYLVKDLLSFGLKYYSQSSHNSFKKFKGSKPNWLMSDYEPYQYVNNVNTSDPIQYQSKKELTFLRLCELLQYEDRNSMAFGIESRVPFLDNELVEYVYNVPWNIKYNVNYTKSILRTIMKNHLPDDIIYEKKKMGFVTPGEDKWLLNELKYLTVNVFEKKDSIINEFVDIEMLNAMNNNGQLKKEFSNHLIWRLINTDLWLNRFIV